MKTATASYMLANNIPAIYIRLAEVNGELKVVADEMPINQVFNSGTKRPEELYFSFESVFEPYQQYSFDAIDGIDRQQLPVVLSVNEVTTCKPFL